MKAFPHPGTFRFWLAQQSFLTILLLWAALYISAGVFFALAYWLHPMESLKASTKDPTRFIDFLHFSFTAQATVGYGDYFPVTTTARLTAGLQALVGTALNALLLGITTYKLLKYTTPLSFPDVLVYDPIQHTFWFRFMNHSADGLCEVVCHVSAINFRPAGGYDRSSSEIAIDYDYSDWLPSARLSALRTKTNAGRHNGEVGEITRDLCLSPLNVSKITTIRLYLKGHFRTTGDFFFADKEYSLNSIRCGAFDRVDNASIMDLSMKRKRQFIGERFERVFQTPREACLSCCFHKTCLLDVATRLRGASKEG